MRTFDIFPIVFDFKQPSGTSRGVLTQKKSWFIRLIENEQMGFGECSIIQNLSPDYQSDEQYELAICQHLQKWVANNLDWFELRAFPSILFGIEMALIDLATGGKQQLFDTVFTRGEQAIRINGLIWMGTTASMKKQLSEKLESGFRCIKMKIGAISWDEELKLLRSLREEFKATDIEIRVDANGAFEPLNAKRILENLAELEVHSIEQPIQPGQWDAMAALCENSPCPIALDEELIGVVDENLQDQLFTHIKPQYLILKPSLHGGFSGTRKWIEKAQKSGIGWWITSALESNLGLNAIAQFASSYSLQLPQGLGTGNLYQSNIPSPLILTGDLLHFDPKGSFDLSILIKN